MRVRLMLEMTFLHFYSRFLINLPAEERSSFERLGFQVEQAFWFYDDFYRPSNPHLPKLTLRSFGKVLLQRYPPLIAPFGRDFDRLYDEFIAYKHAIPVCGAIILNPKLDKCLLVKGWSKSASWGFPKGKIGKDEDPVDCAAREVFEETGFDISPYLNPANFIEATTSGAAGQATRLFIIPGVPESTIFTPQTRKEISKIAWHKVEALPTKYGQDNSYYNVVHFVKKLRNWIQSNGTTKSKSKKKPAASPKKQSKPAKENDIFAKIKKAAENGKTPCNSILMRDNPSPIHLFKKLSIQEELVIPEPAPTFADHCQAFLDALARIRVRKSVIRAAVSDAFSK